MRRMAQAQGTVKEANLAEKGEGLGGIGGGSERVSFSALHPRAR